MAGHPSHGMQKFRDDKPDGFGQHRSFSREREEGPGFVRGRREPSPEMKAYAEKLRSVGEPFKTKIEAFLTAEQQEKLTSLHQGARGAADIGSQDEKEPGFKGKEGKGPRGRDPLMTVIVCKPALERMSRELALNDKQKVQVEKIMAERRDTFLKFVDQNPPPVKEGKPRKEV